MSAATRRPSLIFIFVALAAALAGCATSEEPSTGCSGDSSGAAMTHIHGIAVNPSDPEEVYVATHHGLFKCSRDGRATQVGDVRHDFMGFSVHPTDGNVLWTSGHPENPVPGRTNLGVLQSIDAGATWEVVGLENQVDFHAMAVSRADPDTLYGFFRPGSVWRSLDGGRTWNFTTSVPADSVRAFTTHATDANVVYAATAAGLFRSADRGDTWERLAPEALPGSVVTVSASASPAQPDVLYASLVGGQIARSDDGGATWRAIASPELRAGESVLHIALDPRTPETVYAVVGASAIHKSLDGGVTWVRLTGV